MSHQDNLPKNRFPGTCNDTILFDFVFVFFFLDMNLILDLTVCSELKETRFLFELSFCTTGQY